MNRLWRSYAVVFSVSREYVFWGSYVWVTWLIHMYAMTHTHDFFMCVLRYIRV